MDSIAFPIRFANNRLVVLTEGSDNYFNQLVATTLQVGPGELILEPGFGIKDMTFSEPSASNIKQAIQNYFPELLVDNVRIIQQTPSFDYAVSVSYTY